MLLSKLIGKRYKESPQEASLISHSILLRGGYIRQVANGIYSLLPLGLCVIRKIESIVREEMNRIGGQEVLMPVVLPGELWEESGRYGSVGPELLRFVDRTGHNMILAMTHEEAVVHLSRNEANSYRSYPFMLYQFQTKFRDEPRSRGGLIRVREFIMKDAYSFHTSLEDLEKYYEKCACAYSRIFERVGIPEVLKVQSDTGMMGGQVAHEYMLLADSGEDTIVVCEKCNSVANLEVAVCLRTKDTHEYKKLEKVHTPGKKTITEVAEFLEVPETKTAKAVFYETDGKGKPVMVVIRGDLNVNESKLAKIIQVSPVPAEDETIKKTGAVPGFASPIGIKNCRVIIDRSAADSRNLVTGANETDYHYINFNIERDAESFEISDIAEVGAGDRCISCKSPLTFKRGIEVGNIFQLGTKYSEKMKMTYLDDKGREKIPFMGCYGIGIGRLMAAVIEASHDKFGPIWPVSVAPFTVHINALNLSGDVMNNTVLPVYNALKDAGIETLLDDRNERPGVQFADADLIGSPLRLIFSRRNLNENTDTNSNSNYVEWKLRDGSDEGVVEVSEVVEFVKDFVQEKL
jgi:prolyl-tRNA synthetase